MDKLGQEPAFAQPLSNDGNGNIYSSNDKSYIDTGMSKRFYAACAAMQGLIASGTYNYKLNSEGPEIFNHVLIEHSYELADELLKQENDF